ncbi:hypothetical protein FB479_102697 [Brevibacillus sp. AG162]|uniref:hypothetical protein n=1 Tax=Brevibacillus sp. AG162 TaxID=2572910 RepID=UPI00114FE2E2|nr:hypothetical protein [Brevibacillus sp. AG162]TQK74057.1 hypothetical protein FB479_102697 [Brevibacillus sp. AG162]
MAKGIRRNMNVAMDLIKKNKWKPIVKNGQVYKPQKDQEELLKWILEQKKDGTRPFPSDRLVTNGNLIDEYTRNVLVDLCAAAVDNNWCGRSEMCLYYSCLIRYVLRLLGHKAQVHIGEAIYMSMHEAGMTFSWEHSWVTCDNILIDGNVDTMIENPFVPVGIDPAPYWGDIFKTPNDRIFRSVRLLTVDQELEELDDTYIDWKRRVKKYLKSQGYI